MESVILLMLSQVIIKLIGLIYKLYLTNKHGFGDRGNAIYSGAFQIYALFLTVSSIGVPNAISKLVSAKVAIGDNKGAYRIFKIAFAIFGFIGFAGSSILFLGAKYIANVYLQIPEAEFSVLALSPSVFLVSVASVLRGYFNGRENISVTANSQSLEQLFKTIFTIIIVEHIAMVSSHDTILMASAAALATTIATLFTLIYLYKIYIKNKKEVWKEVNLSTNHKKDSISKIAKAIIMVSIPISLSALFSASTKTIDALTVVRFVKYMVGENEAKNIYGILSGKIDILVALPYSFNIAFSTALVPSISSAIAKKQVNIAKKRIEFSILVTILIGIPCSILMSIFSQQILNILFPNASQGAEMLMYSSWTIIFVVLTQTITGSLQGMGKVWTSVMAFGISAIIKLILNVTLIPIMGVNGAIISSIIASITAFIICFVTLRENLKLSLNMNKFIIKPTIASIIMTFSTYYIYRRLNLIVYESISLIISLFLGMIVYVIAILTLKILSKEEIFMLPYGQKAYKRLKAKKHESQ